MCEVKKKKNFRAILSQSWSSIEALGGNTDSTCPSVDSVLKREKFYRSTSPRTYSGVNQHAPC